MKWAQKSGIYLIKEWIFLWWREYIFLKLLYLFNKCWKLLVLLNEHFSLLLKVLLLIIVAVNHFIPYFSFNSFLPGYVTILFLANLQHRYLYKIKALKILGLTLESCLYKTYVIWMVGKILSYLSFVSFLRVDLTISHDIN